MEKGGNIIHSSKFLKNIEEELKKNRINFLNSKGILLPFSFSFEWMSLGSESSLASTRNLSFGPAANTNSIAIALQTTIQTKRASSFHVFCTFPKEQVAFKMTQFPPPRRDHLRRDIYLKLGHVFDRSRKHAK